jgi:hypothetical protein
LTTPSTITTPASTPAATTPATGKTLLTINVSVVYMVRDIMILMRANPLLEPLEGIGPDNLFWAQIALALLVAISGPNKVSIFRADF